MNTNFIIDAPALSLLIPHSGTMCLLEGVQAWDERTIRCKASSHLLENNPLRCDNILPVQAGIEYAAQAMAAHGELCSPTTGDPLTGYLAVLTQVEWQVERLDNLLGSLTILAERLMAAERGFSYNFQLFHNDRQLLEGRALVALQN